MSRWTHSVCEIDYEDKTGQSVEFATHLLVPDKEMCRFLWRALQFQACIFDMIQKFLRIVHTKKGK